MELLLLLLLLLLLGGRQSRHIYGRLSRCPYRQWLSAYLLCRRIGRLLWWRRECGHINWCRSGEWSSVVDTNWWCVDSRSRLRYRRLLVVNHNTIRQYITYICRQTSGHRNSRLFGCLSRHHRDCHLLSTYWTNKWLNKTIVYNKNKFKTKVKTQ